MRPLQLRTAQALGCLALAVALASERLYTLNEIVTTEPAPAVVGTPGNPISVGEPGDTVTVSNYFNARARYFEQNATWTLRPPTAVPEPGTLVLLGLGLAGLGFVRRNRWALASLAVAGCFAGSAAPVGAAVILVEEPGSGTEYLRRTYTRDGVDIWYGTLSVTGVPAPSQDLVFLSDRIPSTLAFLIGLDASVDPRVKNGLTAQWLNPGQTDIDWVLETNPPPDNFPAQQNLADAYAAAGAALDGSFGPGSLSIGVAATPLQLDYLLARFTTFELFPACTSDLCFASDGGGGRSARSPTRTSVERDCASRTPPGRCTLRRPCLSRGRSYCWASASARSAWLDASEPADATAHSGQPGNLS